MADTTTTNYGFTKPEVNASADTWGDKTNANWDAVDTELAAVDAAKADLTGAAFTGPVETESVAPTFVLRETDGTSTHNQTYLRRDTSNFLVQTRTSGGTLVSSDYLIRSDATGATEHEFRIADTQVVSVVADGVDVAGDVDASGDVTALGRVGVSGTEPAVYLEETDGPAGYRRNYLFRRGDAFTIETRDSAGVLLTTDYVIDSNASGGLSHSFRVAGTERLKIENNMCRMLGTAPTFGWSESGAPTTHNQLWLRRSGDVLSLQTRDSGNNLVATDYRVRLSATGATEHELCIADTQILSVVASGAEVTGNLTVSGGITANGANVLTTADEGAGNGLDADTLDGLQASQFLRDTTDTFTGTLTVTGTVAASAGMTVGGAAVLTTADEGAGNGLDADTLDGLQASQFLRDTTDTFTGTLTVTGTVSASAGMTVGGSTVWHAGNDGAGSGLDADTLDGLQSSQFLRDTTDTFTGTLTVTGTVAASAGMTVGGASVLTTADEGAGNGLDADTLDGLQSSQFLRSDTTDVFTGQLAVSGKVTQTSYADLPETLVRRDALAFLRWNGGGSLAYGAEVASTGSNLYYANAGAASGSAVPAGQTWRCMGEVTSTAIEQSTTMFVRVA